MEEGKSNTLIRLLTKKFGGLPTDLKKKIEQTEMPKIDLMIDEVLDYKSIEEVKATLCPGKSTMNNYLISPNLMEPATNNYLNNYN